MNYKDEAAYKKALVRGMAARGFDVQEHEDKFSRYIPDVSFALAGHDGWMEVKYIPGHHPMPKTLRKIKHLTVGQIDWLSRRHKNGCGLALLVIGTGANAMNRSIIIPGHKIKQNLDRSLNEIAFDHGVEFMIDGVVNKILHEIGELKCRT